ncbi:MAG: D-TA family PLP-dependent enzyme [Rhodothermales bacterium]|nr:D-TA family PLP-dependent enzyme [Rhodothermales bacterium]
MILDDLSTPALLVDESRLAANIDRMQKMAAQQSVGLRPHMKTHKSIAIARRQVASGAVGITVAKVSEAEVFADAGFDDIRIAYDIVGRDKLDRVAALHKRCKVSVCVDTIEGANALSSRFAGNGPSLDVLVEVDTGHGRCGISWDDDDATDFVRHVSNLPGLMFRGLLTHAGQGYHGPTRNGETAGEALDRHAKDERVRILTIAASLEAAGLHSEEISIGSTPSMSRFENVSHEGLTITEVRPGNYVFNDASQVGLTTTGIENCALTVLATVISRRRDRTGTERVYLDAGKKVVTSDRGFGTDGYGILLYNPRTMTPLPHASIVTLSEEHAWVEVHGGSTLQVEDRVQFVPNHACVTVHSRNEMYLVDGDEVIETIPVDARGCTA